MYQCLLLAIAITTALQTDDLAVNLPLVNASARANVCFEAHRTSDRMEMSPPQCHNVLGLLRRSARPQVLLALNRDAPQEDGSACGILNTMFTQTALVRILALQTDTHCALHMLCLNKAIPDPPVFR
jgi:hypothetical protein